MRLAKFIQENVEPILVEWETFARSLRPGARMTRLALRNDAEAILRWIALDMQRPQTLPQQASKSRGRGGAGGAESDGLDGASSVHGAGRVGSGFDVMEMVSEYRALRASVLRLWRASEPQANLNDLDDITRFNEGIDQSLARAVHSFSRRIEESRRMFLSILGHDLRNPLACIRMATSSVRRKAQDHGAVEAISVIENNAQAITRVLGDLIDFASTGLGSAMPVSPGPTDLSRLCQGVIEEFRAAHPGRSVHFQADGDPTGEWDAGRLRQVVSNLVDNAYQYGSADGAVGVSLASAGTDVVLRVHNEGPPIAPEMLPVIFDPLVRNSLPGVAGRRVAGRMGLGLYIVREIVAAHGGRVEVVSTPQDGTTFIVRIPRQALVPSEGRGDASAVG